MDGIATVGEVVASRADGFETGDTVRHAAGWRDYALIEAGRPELGGIGTLMRVDTDAAAPEAYLGALGGSGLTAYVGLFDVASLREGDRRLGLGRRRLRREPRRADREDTAATA